MPRQSTEARFPARAPTRRIAWRNPKGVLWRELQGRQVLGHVFARGYPIERYQVDFYCEALRLAVEVDRIVRNDARALRSGQRRSSRLAVLGIRELRFTDDEVMHNLDGVLASIRRWVRAQPQSWIASRDLFASAAPTPSSRGHRQRKAKVRAGR